MPELLMTFLDVGQGDSTIAVLPDGGAVLVDCPAGSAPTVVDYLESAEITSLELVVITHSDIDHAGGVVQVIKSFRGPTQRIAFLLDRVLKPDPLTEKKYNVMLRELSQLLRDGIMCSEPYAGQAIQFGDVAVSVLHPSRADRLQALAQRNPNDCSVVLRVEYAGHRVLLGADVERTGWHWMVERSEGLKADIFKFPHHGAWHDGEPNLRQILDLVDPSIVVISVGSTNGYGHPSGETLRLLRSLHTTVRFVCTQATTRCHGDPGAISHQVAGLLPNESLGRQSSRNSRSCPCAGNVSVRIANDGVTVSPTPAQHKRVIDLFDNPQCRESA